MAGYREALNLTGQLNPASDSGESHSDAITKVKALAEQIVSGALTIPDPMAAK